MQLCDADFQSLPQLNCFYGAPVCAGYDYVASVVRVSRPGPIGNQFHHGCNSLEASIILGVAEHADLIRNQAISVDDIEEVTCHEPTVPIETQTPFKRPPN